MTENKTRQTSESVEKFIHAINDETKREDCRAIAEMMGNISKSEPKMWGPSIIGFGVRHYKYESGREGDICKIGFSPRRNNITLYIMNNSTQQQEMLTRLGRHKRGKGCLYINKLSDVDPLVLKKLIKICFDAKV
ncbi:MAG TPA: DUF1801 domain-containing protein [Chitinophagaceae bacterium]|nr:DUF1801 domain-containing protein [Chitinophagaceae bacterium]